MPTDPLVTPIESPPLQDDAALDQAVHAVLKDRHVTMLALCTAILVVAFLLQFSSGGGLAVGGVPLPPLCGSRSLLGIECPGCGLTRSFVALAGGDFARSVALHRVGWVLAIVVVLQIPYRLWRLYQLRTTLPMPEWPRWFGYAVIALLIVNWLAP